MNQKPEIGDCTSGARRPCSARLLTFILSLLISVFSLLASAPAAQAACSGPAGNAGDLMYNAGTYHVPQYCDGTLWQQMGNQGAGGAGCSSPAGTEGQLMYNAASHVMQFCDGASWNQIGAVGAGQAIAGDAVSNGMTNGENANDALGQFASTVSDATVVYTTGGANNNNGATVSALGFSTPAGVALDTVNHRLFVSDNGNARVLVYNLNADNSIPASPGHTASYVLGQPDFTHNTFGHSATVMGGPFGLAFDAVNNRLFVADESNNRVLVYNTSTITNGMAASYALGEPDLSTGSGGTTQALININYGVAFDATNERLFVSEVGNNRVTVFNVATGTIATGENASYELGQPSGTAFTSSTPATTQSRMSSPYGVAYDAANNRLFVGEQNNERVTVFNVAPGTIANGENASYELGQPSGTAFTSSTAATTQAGLNDPNQVEYDATNSRLFVAQKTASRVTVFNVTPGTIANGENASSVLGQPDFTTGGGTTTQAGLSGDRGLAYDAVNNRLFVGDWLNNRVMEFIAPPPMDGLVGWWKMDEGAGATTADATGNGNTGTRSGTTLPTWVTTGKINDALTFSGGATGTTASYVSVPDVASLRLAGSWTASVWINLSSLPGAGVGLSALARTSTAGDQNYGIYIDNGNSTPATSPSFAIIFGAVGGSLYYAYAPTLAISTGTWYLVTGTWDGTTLTLYVNGASVASSVPAGVPSSATGPGLYIGGDPCCSTDYFPGTIDDARIYNRALSAAEVGQLYGGSSCGPAAPSSNLVGWWKFDDASSGTTPTTAADSSGNGHTGTNNGSPTWTASGKINNALTFNGSNTYVTMGNVTAMNGLTQITVSAWIKSSSSGANPTEKHIVDKSACDAALNGGPFELLISGFTAGKAMFDIYPNGGSPNALFSGESTTNVDDGNWHFLVGMYDGSVESLWVDGLKQNSNGLVVTMTSTSYVVDIGGYCNGAGVGGGLIYNGTIDDVRVYNVALSAAQIAALYNSASPTYHGEGDLMYNSTYNVMQYCNGTNFVRIGSHAP